MCAALTLTLERKDEDTAALRANHETMRQKIFLLRKTALVKLGLPAEQPAAASPEEPAGATPQSDAPLDLSSEDLVTPRNRAYNADDEVLLRHLPVHEPMPLPLPKPLAEVLREPLRALDEAATKARASVPLRALDEAATKARDSFEREREGLARGLSDALSRLRSERGTAYR